MKHYHYLAVVLAAAAVGGGIAWTAAQESDSAPDPRPAPAEVSDRAESAREAFEREVGAPLEDFASPPVARPEIPEPERMPDWVKSFVPEKDLLQLYCATTKWKTGTFFAAMDALKTHLVPAVQQARALGIDLSAPDVDGMKAEGAKRIAAICAAKTVAEAESLSSDFAQWGRDAAGAGMLAQKADMDAKMRAAGDDIRAKVKTALDPTITEESAKMEKDITAEAQSIAQQVVQELLGANPKAPPDTAAVTALVTQRLQPTIDKKTAELQAIISAKAKSVAGPLQAKLEAVGKLFEGLDAKIAASTAAGEKKYAAEKKKALALRVALLMKTVDKNLDDAGKSLDGVAAEMDEARKTDPSVKTVADLKADMAKSRGDLKARLDAAVAAEDEAGIDAAIESFRSGWEDVSRQAERAAAEPAAAICAQAKAQIATARGQMGPAKAKIDALLAKCATDASGGCLAVNELSARLDGVSAKMADMEKEMALVDEACAAQPVDLDALTSVLKKLENDGRQTGVLADALDAEKTRRVADSVKDACAQIGPSVDAARASLGNDDLVALRKAIEGCRGLATARCTQINALSGTYDAFSRKAQAFMADADKIADACNKGVKDEDVERVMTALTLLGEQGASLESEAAGLRSEMEEKSGMKVFCRAFTDKLSFAKTDLSDAMRQVADGFALCATASSATCTKVRALSLEHEKLRASAKSLFGRIAAADAACAAPSDLLPSQAQLDEADAIALAGDALKKDAAALKAKLDGIAAASPSGTWIEAENEKRSSLLPKTESWHSHKWVTPAPWRPPMFGTGYWYLSRGGEYLEYDVTVPKAGTYKVWVRDYVDKFQPRGVRQNVFAFDGKAYGTFPETTVASPGDKGAFGWHKVGNGVTLSAGNHVMRVTKEKTTSGASIFDAFYLTSGDDAPPEK